MANFEGGEESFFFKGVEGVVDVGLFSPVFFLACCSFLSSKTPYKHYILLTIIFDNHLTIKWRLLLTIIFIDTIAFVGKKKSVMETVPSHSLPFDFMNPTNFRLDQNQKENCYYDRIPFNLKGIRKKILCV